MTRFTNPPDPRDFRRAVWELVRSIPAGSVRSYGEVAKGMPLPDGVRPDTFLRWGARWVGGALAVCPKDVPWHRVVNAEGRISLQAPEARAEQQRRLEAEGVSFDNRGRAVVPAGCGPGHAVRPLEADFFARPSGEVAEALIGKILWRPGTGGGRLVEVEAYLPAGDPACHAYRGMTRRNAAMFGPPGRLYVYLSYGIHHLLNLVCDREGVGSAVLVRAFEPLGDIGSLRRNRGDLDGRLKVRELASGPGRVGQALGLDLSWNGRPLGPESLLVLDDGARPPVDRGARVGISGGRELPLRYMLRDSQFVSVGGRAPARRDP